jgi:hypothetical protein
MGFAYSLAGLVAYSAANGVKSRPEAVCQVKMDVQESSVIHTNREQIVARAIAGGQTHLMFLDDDMVFEPHILDVLMGRRHPIVVANYMIKTEPASEADWVAVALTGNRVPITEETKGIYPIASSGFGVSLFEVEVFKKTPQPWFAPKFIPETNAYSTEDYPCYERLRNAGFTVYMDADASKLVSHLGSKAWNWKEWNPKPKSSEVIPIKETA